VREQDTQIEILRYFPFPLLTYLSFFFLSPWSDECWKRMPFKSTLEERFNYYIDHDLIRPPNAISFFHSVGTHRHNIFSVESSAKESRHLFTVGLFTQIGHELLLTIDISDGADEGPTSEQMATVMQHLVLVAPQIAQNRDLSQVSKKERVRERKRDKDRDRDRDS
jgi:hypothetical protein